MSVRQYQDLIAWQRAMDLVEAAYRCTASLPPDEKYGLTQQIRRAAVSVASNIAEGQGRGRSPDFARFLRIANGSRQEVETQIILAGRLQMIRTDVIEQLLQLSAEVGRLIAGLRRSIPEP